PLKIAAKIDPADEGYFRQQIQPLLVIPWVEFVGEIGDQDKGQFLGEALALLFPIDWPEPFGLVMIESLACGTPVVAFNHGSVPEVLEHGKTAFIVDHLDDAIHAVRQLDQLDRVACRQEFERLFSVAAMADKYEQAYAPVSAARRDAPPTRIPRRHSPPTWTAA